jgi:hypothetical protein
MLGDSKQLILVNGVNVHFGGSGKDSLSFWTKSFLKKNIMYDLHNTVPIFFFKKNSIYYKVALFLYFLPGSFFRILPTVFFEFFYKISLISIFKAFLLFKKKPEQKIIFSHHSVFYLSFFVKKYRRIFLIHDLLFIRSWSFLKIKKLKKIIFKFEIWFYKRAELLLVLSYQEKRILSKFLPQRLILISSVDLGPPDNSIFKKIDMENNSESSVYAVVSDWRRKENRHGILNFLNQNDCLTYIGAPVTFKIYGYNSSNLCRSLGFISNPKIRIINMGEFSSFQSIECRYFFIPIYQGAGIKLKTLEAFRNCRYVIGTKEAFLGFPPNSINNISHKLTSLESLALYKFIPKGTIKDFQEAFDLLSNYFINISDVNFFAD